MGEERSGVEWSGEPVTVVLCTVPSYPSYPEFKKDTIIYLTKQHSVFVTLSTGSSRTKPARIVPTKTSTNTNTNTNTNTKKRSVPFSSNEQINKRSCKLVVVGAVKADR
jgi:hypothetical protein